MGYCKGERKCRRSVLERHLRMEAPGVRGAASHLRVTARKPTAGGRDLTHPDIVFSPPGKKGPTPLPLEVIQACVTRSLEWVGST